MRKILHSREREWEWEWKARGLVYTVVGSKSIHKIVLCACTISFLVCSSTFVPFHLFFFLSLSQARHFSSPIHAKDWHYEVHGLLPQFIIHQNLLVARTIGVWDVFAWQKNLNTQEITTIQGSLLCLAKLSKEDIKVAHSIGKAKVLLSPMWLMHGLCN